jgi:hypothetical protein
MSRNGSGTYNLPAGNPVVTGTTITSNWANTTLTDIGTALTNSVASDGQTPITGNLQMGGNKITGLASGTAASDAATFGQLSAFVPSGFIGMWSGSIASIPTSWLLCDGTNGTPNLRDRFIVGAGTTYAVAATGGSADSTLPTHTHTLSASGTTSSADLSHTHTYSGNTGGTSNDHAHAISDPGHQHGYRLDVNGVSVAFVGNQGNVGGATIAGGTGAQGSISTSTQSSTTGITGTGGQNAGHTHGFSGTTAGMSANATHTHTVTVTGTSGATGNSPTNTNLPPYYALAYIMKA